MTPKTLRCVECGRLVGDHYAGKDHDRMSDPGGVYCEDCTSAEAEKDLLTTTSRDGKKPQEEIYKK